MVKLYFPLSISFSISTIFFLWGCTNGKWEAEAELLIDQQMSLEKRYHQLNASVDSLWDHTTWILEQNLPADIPPMDRDIFLKSRNADHMRMFMSFEKLDPQLQALIHQAGHKDAYLASQMKDLFLDRQQFERRKFVFLKNIEKESPVAGRKIADQLKLRFNTQTGENSSLINIYNR